MELEGKTALVTGGSRGIGKAVAVALAEEGVTPVICGRTQESLDDALAEIFSAGAADSRAYVADVSDANDLDSLISAIHHDVGGVDILINNAGTGSEETILDADDARWDYYWNLHVMAAIRLCRALAPGMIKRGGGVIINNSSICAKQPLGYEPIYNVTKAALTMFSKCLANELIDDNIRVNAVSPGLVRTPDWDKTAGILAKKQGITPDEYLKNIAEENTPIGRFADPKELAHFFVFLCSPKASYCVGSSYYVDGGWLKTTI
jgi:NAD(P)-dependent dehydrogenase (short-subunit alcohol dehydrogenase family)